MNSRGVGYISGGRSTGTLLGSLATCSGKSQTRVAPRLSGFLWGPGGRAWGRACWPWGCRSSGRPACSVARDPSVCHLRPALTSSCLILLITRDLNRQHLPGIPSGLERSQRWCQTIRFPQTAAGGASDPTASALVSWQKRMKGPKVWLCLVFFKIIDNLCVYFFIKSAAYQKDSFCMWAQLSLMSLWPSWEFLLLFLSHTGFQSLVWSPSFPTPVPALVYMTSSPLTKWQMEL